MRNRVRTLTTVTLFAVAVGLVAFVGGRSGDAGLVKLPIGAAGADEAGDAAASTMADRSAMLAPFGGVEYRLAGDLPALPSTAAAYRLGMGGSAADVARLADALGLDGEVREVDNAWAVRDDDRELRVERVAGLPWYLGITCEDAPRPEDAPAGSEIVVTPSGCEVAVAVADGGVRYGCKEGTECPTPLPAPASALAVSPSVRPVPATAPCAPGAPCPATADGCPPNAGCAAPTTAVAPPCPPDAPDCAVAAPATAVAVPACEPGTRCAVDPAAPVTTIPCEPGGACPEPAPSPVPPVEPPPRPADLPSRAEAERIAREAFTRMGVALDGFAVVDGWMTWEARVEPRLDGMAAMGLGWWLGVGSEGRIVHANGFLAQPEKIGDYPLAGVETGLRRLNEGFGGFGTMTAEGTGTDEAVAATVVTNEELRAAEERKLAEERTLAEQRRQAEAAEAAGGQSSAGQAGAGQSGAALAVDLPSPVADCIDPNVPCEPPVAIEPVPMPVPEKVVLDVTGVRLVLLHLDGVLVPSYVFELADGGESPPVPAVTDEWLDQEGVAGRKG